MFTYYSHLSPADNLLCVLRWISSDGILTAEEVWCLADWMNKHREATESWPGTELVPYLQLIWQDGELDTKEVSGLQTLIAVIEREAAGKRVVATESSMDESVAPPFRSSTAIDQFKVPQVVKKTTVRSSNGYDEYSIDMAGPSCTCPDWMDRRRDKPEGSMGRACKHIVRTFFELGMDRQFPPPLWAVLNCCQLRSGGTGPNDEYVMIEVKDRQFVACYGNGDWVNVIEMRPGDSDRFGYNLVQNRWAYGESPKGARGLRAAIHERWPVSREQE
jgi:hypothetical protein